MLRQEVWELDADQAAVFAAGGAVFHGQAMTRARSGIGVNDGAQDLISQVVVRIIAPGGSVRGTALAAHSLASSAGSAKWHAHTVGQNRAFPPAAASDVLSAVPTAQAGDFLVIESGYRNFTVPVSTGGSMWYVGNAGSDLPEDETSQVQLNNWWQVFATGTGGTTGDVPEDTVRQGEGGPGTDGRASRCDHVHEHGLLSADGLHYHNREDIEGSTDLTLDELDDVDTTGVADGQVLKWDATEGLWIAADDEEGVSDLDGLSDVTLTSPAEGDTLRYVGGVWVNSAGFHYEVLMSGASPAEPLEDGSGTDWLYVQVAD